MDPSLLTNLNGRLFRRGYCSESSNPVSLQAIFSRPLTVERHEAYSIDASRGIKPTISAPPSLKHFPVASLPEVLSVLLNYDRRFTHRP